MSHRLAGDQHPGGVGAGVAGHSLQGQGVFVQPADAGVAGHHVFKVRAHVQGLFQGHPQVHGDGLGDYVGLLVAVAQHPAHVPDDAAGGHGAEGDDLADVVLPVLFRHVVDDLLAALVAEVHVDVGHGDPFRVQEALKEQLIAQRVQFRNVQAVGDDAAGPAAAARADHDAVGLGVADKIPHDEEVIHIAHLDDGGKLILHPLAGVLTVRGVPLFKALPAQAAQHFLRRFPGVDGEAGQVDGGKVEIDPAAFRDFLRPLDGVLVAGEEGLHFLLGFDVQFPGLLAQALVVLQGLAGLDAHEDFLGVGVLPGQVMAVVGGHQGYARFLAQGD